ncbi:MAG: hypothetical protein HRT44_10505 [Bdellovibrionales bacterium]|nr:hypothetical protein [Bdellovibrionales bacterium]NQZ19671.1 hypothetical protein [Bdellovibrionales bacterium]
MKALIILIFTFCAAASVAQEAKEASKSDKAKVESSQKEETKKESTSKEEVLLADPTGNQKKKKKKKSGSSRRNREGKRHSIIGSYTPLDTWIPSKFGLQYTYIQNPSTSWEVSWDRGSIGYGFLFVDIASIKDQRIQVTRTSYSKRNSFYLTYGLNYYQFKATLGSALLSTVTGSTVPNIDVLEISSLGGTFGIGNRWQFKNWVLGVNWVSIHVPLVILNSENAYTSNTTNQSDGQTVQDVMDVVERIPTFTAVRVQLGYSF